MTFFGFVAGGTAGAAAIAQGFQTNENNIVAGALVSLEAEESGTVELATPDRSSQLVGVVGSDALIELRDSNKNQTIQVVTNGATVVLVSDINGQVKAGDKIAASPIAGVGMKATESTVVVGVAQADLQSVKTAERTIADDTGKEQTVLVGLIPVQVNVAYFAGEEERASFLPSWLQGFANGVAGQEVGAARVLIAVVVMLFAFVSIAVLLDASVKSSIISIGRNPLAEVSVRKSLLQIGIIAVAILLFTLIAVYLILTL